MIKLYIYCSVLIIENVEVGPDIGMKFHQKVMEIVSYDIINVEPREWILPTPPANKEVTASNAAAAAASNAPPEIPADPLQSGEIQLYSWQLFTPKAIVLDLRGKRLLQHWIWLMLFMSYIYVPQKVINKKNIH